MNRQTPSELPRPLKIIPQFQGSTSSLKQTTVVVEVLEEVHLLILESATSVVGPRWLLEPTGCSAFHD